LSSFAESYDRYRPRPPEALLDLLTRLAGVERPALVVDLGTGTGLSARAWLDRAHRVVGIEPDDAMRSVAEEQGGGVEYVAAGASETRLPDGSADVVTASQSLHWMELAPTFAEVARILRPGGVFAAYDYDITPVVQPEVDAAFEAVAEAAVALRQETGLISPWTRRHAHTKREHLAAMHASGAFSYVRETVLHSVEPGDAERLLGIVRSLGAVEVHRDRLSFDELERVTQRVLGNRVVPFWFGYRVRLGIR